MAAQSEIGASLFCEWITEECAPISESLEALSGEQRRARETPLIERVSVAWATPIDELTCEQVRLLTSQQRGLEWLADPVTTFVRKYPKAFVTFYPGDLSVVALKAFSLLLEFAPKSARAMAQADFDLAKEWRKVDPTFAREVNELVENARTLARGHS